MLKLITLNTDRDDGLYNWEYTASSLGYDYKILGVGQKWGGWSWRTQKYLDYIQTLPEKNIVTITDGNDLFFTRSPTDLLNSYESYNSDVVFGGEPTCCTGKYQYHPFKVNRGIAISSMFDRYNQHNDSTRWMFPNAGCITGKVSRLVEMLEDIKDEPDDQAGYLERLIEDFNYFDIDYQTKIVGNVNAIGYYHCVDHPQSDLCSSIKDKLRNEHQYWDLELTDSYCTVNNTNKIENNVIYEEGYNSFYRYRNNITNNIPCILHFPGKNYELYNTFGSKLYGYSFRPLKRDKNSKDNPLESVVRIWK